MAPYIVIIRLRQLYVGGIRFQMPAATCVKVDPSQSGAAEQVYGINKSQNKCGRHTDRMVP